MVCPMLLIRTRLGKKVTASSFMCLSCKNKYSLKTANKEIKLGLSLVAITLVD